ncbi:MAG: alpha-1,2-fucosyltransferase [Terriglobales bacterium]
MIIAQLNGGLGNQMFQYAFARAIAERRRTSVKLDFRALAADRKRCYALGAWNISARTASAFELFRVRLTNRLQRKLRPAAPYHERAIVREQAFTFDADALKAPLHCLLIGYWQSEKYFKDIEAVIRREFTLREEASAKSQETARAIRSSNSVFLHVRRGDFVFDPELQSAHGNCSAAYYQAAVDHVERNVSFPHFFVFSDDPRWASENLKLRSPMTIVDHNPPGDGQAPGREHEDLWLMSQCKHAVLANSSFSWWGAWLNPARERIVIAPRQWFRSLPHDTRDLIPDRWLRM